MAIKWRLPGPDEPGFLRRRRDLSALLDEPAPTGSVNARVIEYLAQYVEEPADPEEALLDLSQNEYSNVVLTLLGVTVVTPPPLGGRSKRR